MSKFDSTLTSIDSVYHRVNETINRTNDTLVIALSENEPIQNISEASSNISGWAIFLIILLGGLIYFCLSFVKKYIIPAFRSRYKTSKINALWYRITILIAALYFLFLFYNLLTINFSITLTISVLSILFFHQYLIDYLIGVFYQFENQIRVNDNFNLGVLSGEIIAFNNRHLKILNTKKEEILIPYRQLLNTPIILTKKIDNMKRKTIVLQIDGEVINTLSKLENIMARCPWIYDQKNFSIEHIGDKTYHVDVLTKEEFSFNKIESYLLKKIN